VVDHELAEVALGCAVLAEALGAQALVALMGILAAQGFGIEAELGRIGGVGFGGTHGWISCSQ